MKDLCYPHCATRNAEKTNVSKCKKMLIFAERIAFVTKEFSKYTNDTVGGLINASVGNIMYRACCIEFCPGKGPATNCAGVLEIVSKRLLNLECLVRVSPDWAGSHNTVVHSTWGISQLVVISNNCFPSLIVTCLSLPNPTIICGTRSQCLGQCYPIFSWFSALHFLPVEYGIKNR